MTLYEKVENTMSIVDIFRDNATINFTKLLVVRLATISILVIASYLISMSNERTLLLLGIGFGLCLLSTLAHFIYEKYDRIIDDTIDRLKSTLYLKYLYVEIDYVGDDVLHSIYTIETSAKMVIIMKIIDAITLIAFPVIFIVMLYI